MILSRFVRLFLPNLPCADKDDTAESRKYHPLKVQAAVEALWAGERELAALTAGKCCYFLDLWAFSCSIDHVPTSMTRLNRESITL